MGTLKLVERGGACPPQSRFKSEEDPISRCARHGADVLSLRECLSVILQNRGNPKAGLRLASKLLGTLAPDLSEADQARALFTFLESAIRTPTPALQLLNLSDEARLLAAFELARRYRVYSESAQHPSRVCQERSALSREALGRIDMSLRTYSVEWLGFVPVYKTHVGNLCVIARGVRTHVNVDPAELFARILTLRPPMVFLFHNHPSGDMRASGPDRELTQRIDEICRKLGITLLGHWIVSGNREIEIEK